MGNCETCTKRNTCKKDIGIIFGGCRTDYVNNSGLVLSAYRPLMSNGKK